MESYRQRLLETNKIYESGLGWLSELRDRLKMAAEERHRMEDERGNPTSKEESRKTKELLETANLIDRAIQSIKQMLSHAPIKEDA